MNLGRKTERINKELCCLKWKNANAQINHSLIEWSDEISNRHKTITADGELETLKTDKETNTSKAFEGSTIWMEMRFGFIFRSFFFISFAYLQIFFLSFRLGELFAQKSKQRLCLSPRAMNYCEKTINGSITSKGMDPPHRSHRVDDVGSNQFTTLI